MCLIKFTIVVWLFAYVCLCEQSSFDDDNTQSHVTVRINREELPNIIPYERSAEVIYEFSISELLNSVWGYQDHDAVKQVCNKNGIVSTFCKELKMGKKLLIAKIAELRTTIIELIKSYNREMLTLGLPEADNEMVTELGLSEEMWASLMSEAKTSADVEGIILHFERRQPIFNFPPNDSSTTATLQNPQSTCAGDVEDNLKDFALKQLAQQAEAVSDIYLRIANIVAECRHQRLPIREWNSVPILSGLRNLNKTLASHGLVLAVGPEQILHEPLQWDIADCFFTRDTLRVLVGLPARSVNDSWSVYKYSSGAFRYREQKCNIVNNSDVIVATNGNGSYVFFAEADLQHCHIDDNNGICLIPKGQEESVLRKNCLAGLLLGMSLEALRDICEYQCYNESTFEKLTALYKENEIHINIFLIFWTLSVLLWYIKI